MKTQSCRFLKACLDGLDQRWLQLRRLCFATAVDPCHFWNDNTFKAIDRQPRENSLAKMQRKCRKLGSGKVLLLIMFMQSLSSPIFSWFIMVDQPLVIWSDLDLHAFYLLNFGAQFCLNNFNNLKISRPMRIPESLSVCQYLYLVG